MSQTEKAFVPWYMKKDVVKGYEGWYEGKYKRADDLEKHLLSVMIEQYDKPKKIIEVGSGTSHFTRWLSSQGYQAVGADLSPLMVRQAKTLWKEGELFNARSSNLPFGSDSFDLVVFVTCFEYMPDPVGVLREASRIARQGIVMGLMNAWSLPTFRRKLQMAFGKNDYYLNAHFYSIREMKGLVKQAFKGKAALVKWRTTLFPEPLGIEGDSGSPFGAFLGVAIKKT